MQPSRTDSGRLVFLGLGTSVGAAIIADDTVVPLEIGMMPLSKSEGFMDRLSKEALNSLGKGAEIGSARGQSVGHLWPDHFQIGGGNAKLLDPAQGCERGDNQDAFRGALRLRPGATCWPRRKPRRGELRAP
jgi:polyphosphate glucokinase